MRDEDGEVNAIADDVDLRAYYTIEALGGKDNIKQVDYCTTRLRLLVQDSASVDENIEANRCKRSYAY